jgi:perosamine synthetase
MTTQLSRRKILTLIGAGAAASGFRTETHSSKGSPEIAIQGAIERPALLGGAPIRSRPFPSWPVIKEGERRILSEALDSGRWNRSGLVERFEEEWAKTLGVQHVVATSSGTSALYTSLAALGVGPGDEVIVPPYTFVATVSVVLLHHALPIFVDSDRETFQIDAGKIEAAITPRTRCILPVHLGGNVADMDAISELGERHRIPVLEDACQAHLAEWRGKKVGGIGALGCFSFQATKNLNSGEGGAISTQDGELATLCASFQDAGRGYSMNAEGRIIGGDPSGLEYVRNGDNRRITEFQGGLLLEQLKRLEDQSRTRERNAAHLTRRLQEIPGIEPARSYPGCTRNGFHLYMFRYEPEAFANLSRRRFLAAMQAEGISCWAGYRPLNREPFLEETFRSRAFRKVYTERELNELAERNHCPENDRLCEEAVWLGQTQLLGAPEDMDDVADAIEKIQTHAESLV